MGTSIALPLTMLRSGIPSDPQNVEEFGDMTPEATATLIKNLDLRTSRIEQVLPTLATKDDLKVFATKDDLKAFATKDDLKTYATKEEMREALHALEERLVAAIAETRRHAVVLNEDVRGDIRLLAEHLAELMSEVRQLRHERPST
jgi:hypothetical protein